MTTTILLKLFCQDILVMFVCNYTLCFVPRCIDHSYPSSPLPSPPPHTYTVPVTVSSLVKDAEHVLNISVLWKVIQHIIIMQHYVVLCKHTQLVMPRVTRNVEVQVMLLL